MLKDELENIKKEFLERLALVKDKGALEEVKGLFVGRKRGKVNDLFLKMAALGAEEKREFGQAVNRLKVFLEEKLEEREKFLASKGSRESVRDDTLPGTRLEKGSAHLLNATLQEISSIFLRMGYSVEQGREVESDYFNFTALNIPEEHPARDDHDTFYLEHATATERYLLRTHTTPVQARTMSKGRPPFKFITPGRVFRKDEPDDTHSPVFHQVDGVLVDHVVTFADLKGTIKLFLRTLFGPEIVVRFRPSFFPFTEPSAEVDVFFNGRWLEVLGCGMIDPAVFSCAGIDSEEYTGFAFGMGIERLTMVRCGVPSLRLLYENDLRFLRQFP